jgi:Bacterial capsule synthesis protein PGA_cap
MRRRGTRGRAATGFVCAVTATSSIVACTRPPAEPGADDVRSLAVPVAIADQASAERAASRASIASLPSPVTTGAVTATVTAPPVTAPATVPPTASPASEPPDRRITIAVAGDILPHSPLWRRAADNAAIQGRAGFDFTPMLAGLAPVVAEADLGICHLETPIAPAGEQLSTMPFYGVPAEIADAIVAAGFDRCSTASNHALDRGAAGIDRTIEVLADAGLGQSGMARTPDEIAPGVLDVRGVAVAHLSYTYGYNGLRPPPGEEWRSALIDPLRIVDDSRAARALGAEVVVVSLHWGAEGEHEPTTYQRDVANWLTASGAADLIVGHHAHVVQPIEQLNGRWVIFGLGNVLSNLPTSDRWPAAAQDAMFVTVSVSVAADGTVTVDPPAVTPTWVDRRSGWVVRLVLDELGRGDLDAAGRAALEASLARTNAVVGEHLP